MNQKASYILLGSVGCLMLLIVLWYIYNGGTPAQEPEPAPAEQSEIAGENAGAPEPAAENLSETVRGTMPEQTAHAPEQDAASAPKAVPRDVSPSDMPLAEQKTSPADVAEQKEPAAEKGGKNAPEAEGAVATAPDEQPQQSAEAKEEEASAEKNLEQGAKKAARAAAGEPEQAAAEKNEKAGSSERNVAKKSKQSKPKPSIENNTLTAVNVVPTQYGVVIRLQTSRPVRHTRWSRLKSPNRVYIDLFGTFRNRVSDKKIPDNPYVGNLRIGLHKNKLRVVADIASGGLPNSIKVSKNPTKVVVLELSDFK